MNCPKVGALALLGCLACSDRPTAPTQIDIAEGPPITDLPAPPGIQYLMQDPFIRDLVELSAGVAVADELAVTLGRLEPSSKTDADVHAATYALARLRSSRNMAGDTTQAATADDPVKRLVQDALDLVVDHAVETLAPAGSTPIQ